MRSGSGGLRSDRSRTCSGSRARRARSRSPSGPGRAPDRSGGRRSADRRAPAAPGPTARHRAVRERTWAEAYARVRPRQVPRGPSCWTFRQIDSTSLIACPRAAVDSRRVNPDDTRGRALDVARGAGFATRFVGYETTDAQTRLGPVELQRALG